MSRESGWREQFQFDVLLSHSSKDKDVVRALAERLRGDGLRVWFDEWTGRPDEEGLEQSRVLVLCMSANAFGSDWARLEAGTFQFRDPLNKERRFVPLRLDEAPISESLGQFLCLDWTMGKREAEYPKLVEACRYRETPASAETLAEKIISLGHTGAVRSVAWSPDGKRALSGSVDNTVRVWDVEEVRCLRVLEGHAHRVYSLGWSGDGKRALSGSDDSTVRVWDVEEGRCLRVLEGHTDGVSSVAWSGDGTRALSGSLDSTVRVWDVEEGRCLRVLKGHTDRVLSVAWSGDGKRALSGSDDSTLWVWDVEEGRCLRVLEGHTHSVYSVAWSGDGKRALSGSDDSTVRVWDVEEGRCLHVLEGHTARVLSVAWKGKRALSGSDDNTVRVWDVEERRCLRVLAGHTGSVWSVAWSGDGKRALSGSHDRTVRVWDVEEGRCLGVLAGHTGSVWSVAWSGNGKRAPSGSEDRTVRVWDVEEGRCLHVLKGHTARVLSVAWSGDGKRVLSGSWDRAVRVWDVEEGRCLHVLEGHTAKVWSVAWSGDGKRVLSGSWDRAVRVWDVEEGRCLHVLKGHTHRVWSVAWSGDGKRALSGSHDRTVRVWDVEEGRCLHVLEGHTARVWSVAWSGDGKQALSGSDDSTVRVWDVEEGRCLRVLEGHTDGVSSVAWSGDGRRALSGSHDRTVRVWDVEEGRCLRVLEGHADKVRSVAWSGDGKHAFSAAENGVMRVWNVSPEPEDVLVAKEVKYTNAKVLLVGESGVGKTGLSTYLAHGIRVEEDKPLSSTDGAWATQWLLRHSKSEVGVEREIWLWDFAGQVDYRLVHQLFLEETAAAVLVFNPQSANPYEGLGHWDSDLRKAAARRPFAKLLAAGRVDRGGLVGSAARMTQFMEERGFRGKLHLTSALTGDGCDGLKDAVLEAIDWQSIPKTTSPALYRRMKEEILKMRDGGLVLIRMAELKQRMEMTLGGEDFELAELSTVVDLLAGPGMIQRLDFGDCVLLRPEVLSRYASAVARKVRKHPQELGCIREDDLLAGDLDYQDFQRLPREDEEVVLRALLKAFVSRAWCLRQPCEGSAMLTFPSYFRRERRDQPGHPSVLVTYRFDGPADDIYATLVVRLHHTEAFESVELWRSAADFQTLGGQKLGFTMQRESEGTTRLDVYFEPDVDENSRLLFLRYVEDHLHLHGQGVVRLRRYYCTNKKCDSRGQAFENQAKIDKALAARGKRRVFCPECGKEIPLLDAIEKKFESKEVKAEASAMQQDVQAKLDNESLELILVGHAYAIPAEAGQIYRGYANSDHGIDGEIEFKDDQGRASGKRLYLQLKSGDSYLKKRKSDGAEIFPIKNPRWRITGNSRRIR